MPSSPVQRRIARELLPFLAWICGITVALAIRYGYYGNHNLVMSPNMSRMLKASSLLVEDVQFKDGVSKGLVLVHGFTEQPELSLESNRTVVNHLNISSYGRQGFSLWLNKGSKIWMTCEVTYGSSSNGNMYMVVIKGEQNLKESHMFHKRRSHRSPSRSSLDVADSPEGFVVLFVHLILHQLEACESNGTEEEVTIVSETEPILPRKEMSYTYNTNEEDPASGLCCSSNDLYEKICAICYDESRSCFFTPCGHSITCRTCAKRIMEEENRVCPICRRLIHKVRQLVSASTKSWIQEKETTD